MTAAPLVKGEDIAWFYTAHRPLQASGKKTGRPFRAAWSSGPSLPLCRCLDPILPRWVCHRHRYQHLPEKSNRRKGGKADNRMLIFSAIVCTLRSHQRPARMRQARFFLKGDEKW